MNIKKKKNDHKEEMQMANRHMLSITVYQGNANQNYHAIAPSHLSEWCRKKEDK